MTLPNYIGLDAYDPPRICRLKEPLLLRGCICASSARKAYSEAHRRLKWPSLDCDLGRAATFEAWSDILSRRITAEDDLTDFDWKQLQAFAIGVEAGRLETPAPIANYNAAREILSGLEFSMPSVARQLL